MIYHPLMRMKRAGVTEVAVVTSPEHMGDVVNLLGSGDRFGLDLTYRVQDEPGGIAQAIGLCRTFTGSDPFVVILGDNVFADDIAADAEAYRRQIAEEESGARVLLKQVPDPERYGVPRLDGDRIVEIIEKPSDPPSEYAVVGVYFYDSGVYDIIDQLQPSRRGEYEVSDVSNAYIERGAMTHGRIDGWWGDAGTIEGWHEAKDRKSTRLNSSHVAISYAVFCLKKKNNNYHLLICTDTSTNRRKNVATSSK